jgi:hypothetical protein
MPSALEPTDNIVRHIRSGAPLTGGAVAGLRDPETAALARYLAIDQMLGEVPQEIFDRARDIFGQACCPEDAISVAVLRFVDEDESGADEALTSIIEDPRTKNPIRMRARNWRRFVRTYVRRLTDLEPPKEPPYLFQYWDRDPPEDVVEAMDRWRDLPGTGRYHRFDDEEARDVIRDHVGDRVLKAYDECWHPAMKSDIFRLVELHRSGGVYTDADNRPPNDGSVISKLSDKITVCVYSNKSNSSANNAFLSSPREHPIWELCIEFAVENVLESGKTHPMQATGPGILNKCLGIFFSNELKPELLSIGNAQGQTACGSVFGASYKKTSLNWKVAVGYFESLRQ